MFVAPPSPPTRVASTRTCCELGVASGRSGTTGAGGPPGSGRATAPAGVPAGELDLDAVADDAGERLRYQRAIAALQPVLGEAVRDRDPEAVVLDVDEHGVAQPGLEVCGREGNLQLPEGGAPDLLRVHTSMTALCGGLRWMGGRNGLAMVCCRDAGCVFWGV